MEKIPEPDYHTIKWFSEKLLATEINKTKVKIIKPIYLGLSILELSKTVMYEFWYDCINSKNQDKADLCYMDTDSFTLSINTEDVYKDTEIDVEKRFETSNYEIGKKN